MQLVGTAAVRKRPVKAQVVSMELLEMLVRVSLARGPTAAVSVSTGVSASAGIASASCRFAGELFILFDLSQADKLQADKMRGYMAICTHYVSREMSYCKYYCTTLPMVIDAVYEVRPECIERKIGGR
jgi:hypothetical protein